MRTNPLWTRRTRRLRPVSAALVAALVVGTVSAAITAPAAAADPWKPRSVPELRSVPGRTLAPSALPAEPAAARRPAPAVDRPAAGSAVVALADRPVRAGSLPVRVARAGSTGSAGSAGRVAAGPAQVRVDLLDAATTARAGSTDLLLRVARADGKAAPARVAVEVDYTGIAAASGGDHGSRLGLVRLPACAATTPSVPACRAGTPVAARNEVAARRLSATVDTGAALLAVTAAPAGSAGDFTATPLSSSASWQVSAQTGDFGWSYPMRVPPPPGGTAPQVGLSYSSGSVDGRVVATNNQPSWVGEGFDLGSGFIERKYAACGDDGVTVTPKPADLCWKYDNATMSLNGRTTELVRDDATGAWRPRDDDGSRVEKLTSATNNGDNDGEHWRVTTVDGTQYHFGLNRLPGWAVGRPETASTLRVPVFGNNAGEPCNASTFAASSCYQGWRWNLDYVVDPRGNATTYWYVRETNHYGRNRLDTGVEYDRAGHLERIDYGLRSDALFGTAPARVSFAVAERCLPSPTFTCAATQFTKDTANNWPDVPFDQYCAVNTSCAGRHAPTFWTRKRLTGVSTQVWGGTAYRDVDSWTLRHDLREPGDGTGAALWLEGITHTGKVGGPTALPEVTFTGVQLPNRVNGLEGLPSLTKWRVAAVASESGGVLSVNYSTQDCAPGSTPAPDTNTRRCFPTYWTPEGAFDPQLDWFHKYVVTSVVADSRQPVDTDETTTYDYLGGAAWHWNDDPLTLPKYRTWSQFRGFGKVRVTEGATSETRGQTEYLYLRGMHGDRTAAGGTKTVTVTDSQGGTITDSAPLTGFSREETVLSGPGGSVVSSALNTPWVGPVTARRAAGGVTVEARMTETATVRTRTALTGGTWRTAESTTVFAADGLPESIDDAGDLATPDDDRCTRTTYARNTARHLLDYPSRVETVSARCAATPARPGDIVSDARTYYDSQAAFGAAPTRGEQTKAEELADWNGGPVYAVRSETAYDAYGRPTRAYDAMRNLTTTTYTPATGPVTTVTTTNPAQHIASVTLDPAWGVPKESLDANGKRTTLAYDALGRLTKVWRPGRPTTSTPHVEYAYAVQKSGTSVVTTKTLRPNGTYTTAYALYDGLLRVRQTQAPAPGGGRVVTDTAHDSRGQVVKASGAYYNNAAPSTTVLEVADNQVPSHAVAVYDGVGRKTVDALFSYGTEKWRTTTSYSGDRTTVDPPAGGTPTTTLVDAQGRLSELRQYRGDSATGAYDSTRYTVDHAGRPATVTDPQGSVWRTEYDLLGRPTRTTDPDRGTTTTTYDPMDRPVTVTDARGAVLASTYDSLGRRRTLRDGSVTGPVRAQFDYDTVAKGQLSSSTRYVGADAYTRSVTAYDDEYRATGTKLTLPAGAGFATAYTFARRYNVDGTLDYASSPAAGGLGAEIVKYSYNELGMPVTVGSGLGQYAIQTTYTKIGQLQSQVYATAASGAQRVQHTLSYDDATGWLSRATVDREVSPMRVSDTGYRYDQVGTITSMVDDSAGQPRDTQCFAYDSLRRLTEAWTPAVDCAAPRSAATLGGPAPYWHSYGYDASGNRRTETRHAVAGDTVSTYTYPAATAAQPHAVRSVSTTGPAGSGVDTYDYDAVGNTRTRTKAGVGQTLTWDAEGHLASVEQGGQTTSYLYDATGDRLLRKDAGGSTLYLDGMELRLAGGLVSGTRYYSAGGAPFATRTTAGVSWLLADHQGTARTSIGAVGQAVVQRRQTPFGQPRGTVPAWPSEQGFVGGTGDPTGLTHLGAREYDPALGRFVSVDPLLLPEDPQQMQGYSYANNSPVTFSDPDGLYCAGPDGLPCQNFGERREKERARQKQAAAAERTAKARRAQAENAPTVRAARQQVSQSEERVRVAKERVVRVVKDLGKIAMEELGITAGLDCLTRGDVGACIETGITVITGAVGGILAKLARKYGAPWKWDDFMRLKSRVWSLIKEGVAGVADWARSRGALKTAKTSYDDAVTSCLKGNSFVPGTLVVLADGRRVPIERVRVGDRVLATDPETGRSSARPVVATIIGTGSKDLVEITVGAGVVIATAGHPFWVPELHRWVDAGDLRPGHHLRTAAGTWVPVSAITHRTAVQKVHNLTVATTHTFYALAGPTPLLTHNCNGAPPPNLSPEGAGRRGAFNQAKRDSGIPTSQSPNRTGPNLDRRGNLQPGRVYEWDLPSEGGGPPRRVTIRDDSQGHVFPDGPEQNRGPHFNTEDNGHYDY